MLILGSLTAALPFVALVAAQTYGPLSAEGLERLSLLRSDSCARRRQPEGINLGSLSQVARNASTGSREVTSSSSSVLVPASPKSATDEAYATPVVVKAAAKIEPTPSPAPVPAPVVVVAAAAAKSPDSGSSGGNGLFGVSGDCGSSGAIGESTLSAGPNGAQDFLNCGISNSNRDGQWNPPSIKLNQLKTLTLEQALDMPNSPFSACRPFVSLFEQHGDRYGIPPIMLAAFAMQESSCRPGATGDHGGAFGLMQITQDKCFDAPGGDCRDPSFNIGKGAWYFREMLSASDGNVLLALGKYNGWYKGLTYNGANKIASQCCQCVNNLDYLHSFVNGWILGIDGSKIGYYKNAVCE